MDVIYPRCAGLDVHKKLIVACRLVPGPDGELLQEIQKFGTTTAALLRLADWLAEAGVTHVAMESTGVYWKPVYNLLEGLFELLVVNAQHIKAVTGRKTDVKDSEWIATLLRHGLLRASFVPPRAQRELRELTRYRTSLVQERTAEVNRLHKTLEGANIKLSSVASNIVGVSCREMLAGLVAGHRDAAALAQLARGRMREKLPELEQALRGRFATHQRFLVARQLAHIDHLEEAIEAVTVEIARRLQGPDDPAPGGGEEAAPCPPWQERRRLAGGDLERELEAEAAEQAALRGFGAAVARLCTITGVKQRTAEVIVAEIGIDMSRFPTSGHMASWSGICPGNHESGGKRKSGKTRKGSPWLRSALVEAARAAARSEGTYLSAQYHRIAARRGKKKAAVAVAHSILVIAYHLIQNETTYQDLGGNYFDKRTPEALKRQLIRRLERLGCTVTVEEKLAA